MQRVARNESGGRKDAYTLVGERSRRGDYPYGKYQVMGENIPKWTAAYLGREMTPKEFLADPDAQDQVARARGGEYMTKYGADGAARAWFAGENGMNDPKRKDTLGTHVAEYSRRFNIPLVSRDQIVASAARPATSSFGPDESGMATDAAPVRLASLGGGMPTPDTAPDPREAIAQRLAGPQPQQVAQAAPPMQPGVGPGTLGAVPAPPLQQQQQIAAPSLPPSREPIPPPALEAMKDPGNTPPPPPKPLGPSQQQQYWLQQLSNPMLSERAKEHATRMYATEETYRKEIQSKQEADYKNERER